MPQDSRPLGYGMRGADRHKPTRRRLTLAPGAEATVCVKPGAGIGSLEVHLDGPSILTILAREAWVAVAAVDVV